MNYSLTNTDFRCLSYGVSEFKSKITKGNISYLSVVDKKEDINYEFNYIYFYFTYSNLLFAKIYLESNNIQYQVLLNNINAEYVIITDYSY
jgi:hypothetical protein